MDRLLFVNQEYVLEQNPPKQGLKHAFVSIAAQIKTGFRAKSTKTRIETFNM